MMKSRICTLLAVLALAGTSLTACDKMKSPSTTGDNSSSSSTGGMTSPSGPASAASR